VKDLITCISLRLVTIFWSMDFIASFKIHLGLSNLLDWQQVFHDSCIRMNNTNE